MSELEQLKEKYPLAVDTLEAICGGLGVSVASLFLMVVDDSKWSVEKRELFRLYVPHVLELLKK